MAAGSSTAAQPGERELVITRVFDAPHDLVWTTFTEPDHLKHWWGPKGFTTQVHKLELRPGGAFFYSQKTPDGREMYGKWVYREVLPPVPGDRFVVHRRQRKSRAAPAQSELAARDARHLDIHREPGAHGAHAPNPAN